MLGSKRLSCTAFLATSWCTLLFSQAVHAEDLSLCVQGWAATERRDFSKALPLYDECMKTGNLSQSSLAQTHRNIATTYREMGRPQLSIDHEDKALALRPIDAWNDHVNRGNAASDLGRFDDALADYDRAAALKPNLADVHYNRGIVYERLQQIDKAKAEFLEADRKGLHSAQVQERLSFYKLTPAKASANTSPEFNRFTDVLSAKLESDALTAMSRRLFMNFALAICPRVSQDATEALKAAVRDWDQRNAPYMEAAASVLRAFGVRHLVEQDEASHQAYTRMVARAIASHAVGEVKRVFNNAAPDNQIIPPEAQCRDLAPWIAAGRVDFTNTPSAVRELETYMQREKTTAP